jgi:hypothetical protein
VVGSSVVSWVGVLGWVFGRRKQGWKRGWIEYRNMRWRHWISMVSLCVVDEKRWYRGAASLGCIRSRDC